MKHGKDYYDKLKHDVMSEAEIKEANKFMDYYRSSWRDKENRGLFDKWEKMDLYWEGEVNLPESDADPGSNTNIIHPNVEGQVALLVEQNIAIQTEPVGPSDMPFQDAARIMLEFVKEKNKMKRKLDVHERRREKYGTGIFRVTFNPDALNGFGLPEIRPCNPAYVFTDPNIIDIYDVQDGEFIIESMMKSLYWAQNNERFDEERAKAIMPGFSPIEGDYIFGEDDGENDEISRNNYLHLLVWTKKKGKLRLVEMSACGAILYDSMKDDEEGYYPNNKYPYFFTPMYYREGTVWAKGDAELLIDNQDLINDLDDQMRMNARLSGNPQKVINTASGIDVDKWTNEPSLNIPANDPNNAFRMVEPPNMPAYIQNRRDMALMTERQIITRFSDQMTGQRVKGVDTATEALSLQQAGATGIDHKKLLLQETLSDVFEYILDMIKEYYTEEQAFRITEKENQFIFFRGSQLKEVPYMIPASQSFVNGFTANNPDAEPPQWMQNGTETKEAMFDIKVTVGAGMPNNKAFIYQVIREAFRDGVLTPQEYRKLLIQYVALPVEEEPPMQTPQPMDINMINADVMGGANPEVAGLSQRGNPAGLGMLGGGMGAI
ncbi:portal protein [Anaerosolibacter sp.]|uniref:portal protein n=1 Tax=Anaerosolibacter sp. TaxID=1872527 RepID=UPI0039EE1E28